MPPVAVLLAKNPLVEKYDLTCVERAYCGAAPLSGDIEKEVLKKLKGPKLRFYQCEFQLLMLRSHFYRQIGYN